MQRGRRFASVRPPFGAGMQRKGPAGLGPVTISLRLPAGFRASRVSSWERLSPDPIPAERNRSNGALAHHKRYNRAAPDSTECICVRQDCVADSRYARPACSQSVAVRQLRVVHPVFHCGICSNTPGHLPSVRLPERREDPPRSCRRLVLRSSTGARSRVCDSIRSRAGQARSHVAAFRRRPSRWCLRPISPPLGKADTRCGEIGRTHHRDGGAASSSPSIVCTVTRGCD
jgi:hypothetical protein